MITKRKKHLVATINMVNGLLFLLIDVNDLEIWWNRTENKLFKFFSVYTKGIKILCSPELELGDGAISSNVLLNLDPLGIRAGDEGNESTWSGHRLWH